MPALIKSRQRVADHGEVFTPPWLVERMLDLVRGESARIDARFLEPACGSGNFLVPILQRKLAAVDAKYEAKYEAKFAPNPFERQHAALLALMCCYGIELLADNIAECRANMLAVFAGHLELDGDDDTARAAAYVLSQNIVHGDALTLLDHRGAAIRVPEWGYLGRGKFQRRDFLLSVLTGSARFGTGDSLDLFARQQTFTPLHDGYPPMGVRELARAGVAAGVAT